MGRSPNWAARSYYTDQASPLHQADPSHFGGEGSRGSVDPGAYAHAAPAVDQWAAEELGYVAELDESWSYGLQTDGLVIDSTPQTHEVPAVLDTYGDDAGLAAASAAVHGYDQGASRQRGRVQAGPPMQFADESYLVKRFESFGPGSLVDPITSRRGLNGLPENNPDGFHPGTVEQVWVDRKFAAVVARGSHDERIVTPNTAAAPVNQPVPADANVANSPFDSLARPITNIWQRPQQRREQPGLTESLLTDDLVYPAESGEWVAG